MSPRNFIFVILTSLSIQIVAQPYDWQWAKASGGMQRDDGKSICRDVTGNVYVTGFYESPTIKFGAITLTNSSSYSDMFVVKYDANGNVLWAKSYGGIKDEIGNSICIDSYGSLYVTGAFSSPTISFGTATLTNGVNNALIYIVKLDALGNVQWAKSSGGFGTNSGSSICLDKSGSIIVTGFFSGTLNIESVSLNSYGADIFVAKFGGGGNLVWLKGIGGTYNDYGTAVSTDSGRNVFVTGVFQSPTINFSNTTLTSSSTNSMVPKLDVIVAKYDFDGNELWAKSAGGLEDDFSNSISTDLGGNTYICGNFSSNSITFGSTTFTKTGNGAGIFTVKYDNAGNVLWANGITSLAGLYSNGITCDAEGNAIITGGFDGIPIVFGSTTLSCVGSRDIYITKYDGVGNVLWAKSVGGPNVDVSRAVVIDGDRNIFITGTFVSSTISFGGSTITNADITEATYDYFIAKLGGGITGLKDESYSNKTDIFPNPFSAETIVETDGKWAGATLILTNNFGQKVKEVNNIYGNRVLLRRESLSAGFYYFRLSQGDQVISAGKLVVID